MICKFCLAELEEDANVCSVCGKDLTEVTEMIDQEPEAQEAVAEVQEEAEAPAAEETEVPAEEKKKPKAWKIALAVVGGVVLLAALVGAVLYGLGIKILPQEGVLRKDSYTVDNAAGEKKASVVVATLGDQVLTNSDLQAHYWMNVFSFLNEYGYYLTMMGLDPAKPLDEQVYDEETGMTYQQMFLDDAIKNWERDAALAQLAQDAGFTLSDEQRAYLDSVRANVEKMAQEQGYTDVEEFVDKEFFPNSSLDSYMKCLEVNHVAYCYFESLYDSLLPSQQEVEDYYAANEEALKGKGFGKDDGNYYDVRHILIEIEGGTEGEDGVTTYTDAQWEACRAAAQKMLDDFLANEPTEEKFAQLAVQNSKDPGSAANGGLYSKLTKDYGFIEDFENWYTDENRKVGDTGLVKNTQSSVQGYHIMYFSGITPIWEYETETALLSENTNKLLEEAKEKWPTKVKYNKIALGHLDLA